MQIDPTKTTVLWTAVPAGTAAGAGSNLKVSICVGPRPAASPAQQIDDQGAHTLRDLLFDNWPKFLKQGKLKGFTVQFWRDVTGGSPVIAHPVTVNLPLDSLKEILSDKAWSQIFSSRSNSWGGPFVRDRVAGAQSEILPTTSYSSQVVASFFEETSNAVATHQLKSRGVDPRSRFSSRLSEVGSAYDIRRQLSPLQWERIDANSRPIPDPLGSDNHDTLQNRLIPAVRGTLAALHAEAAKVRNPYRVARNPVADLHPRVVAQIKRFSGVLAVEPPSSLPRRPAQGVRGAGWAEYAQTVQDGYLQLACFHGRVPNPNPNTRAASPNAENRSGSLDDGGDFIERLSLLNNYPSLLRPLGLVIDLELPLTAKQLSREHLAVKYVSVVPIFDGADNPPFKNLDGVSPLTEFTLEPGVADFEFRAADDAKSPFAGGYFNLCARRKRTHDARRLNQNDSVCPPRGDAQFDLHTWDTDGAALKLIGKTNRDARVEGAVLLTDADGSVVDHSVHDAVVKALREIPGSKTLSESRLIQEILPFPEGDPIRRLLGSDIQWDEYQCKFKVVDNDYRIVTASALREGATLTGIRWQLAGSTGYVKSDELQLPTRRSSGISLVWVHRAAHVKTKQERAQELRAQQEQQKHQVLKGNDLVMGFVPEVWVAHPTRPGEGRWFSLTRRKEKYPSLGIKDREVEGLLRWSVGQATDCTDTQVSAPARDLHVGECVFRWDGWSLGVSADDESSKALLRDEQHTEISGKKFSDQDVNRHWTDPVECSVVPHSLPPLRYATPAAREYGNFKGWPGIYRVRVKTVDIAGNSVGSASRATALEKVYQRSEPVPPPEILLDQPLCKPDSAGRALGTMVILDGKETDTRWLVPPRASFSLVESHGLLDNVRSIEKLGGFNDVKLHPTSGDLFTPDKEGLDDPVRCPAPHDQHPRIPPYPDPYALDVRYRLLDCQGSTILVDKRPLNFYRGREWPKARAIQVSIQNSVEAAPHVDWHALTNQLMIYLPPGVTVTLQLWSGMGHAADEIARLNSMSVWNETVRFKAAEFLAERYKDTPLPLHGFEVDLSRDIKAEDRGDFDREVQTMAQAVLETGAVESITPLRTMLCINACHQPLARPSLTKFFLSRGPGLVSATINAEVMCHARTTSKVVLSGSWDEYLDDEEQGVRISDGRWISGDDLSIPDRVVDGLVPVPPIRTTHAFIDRKYRRVKYQAIAVSQYQKHFPEDRQSSAQSLSNAYCLDVLATAEPDPPKPAYIMPVFNWDQRERGNPISGAAEFLSTRFGSMCRVYFRPGWHSSGACECAAVLLYPDAHTGDVPEVGRRYASRWGLDPLRQSLEVVPPLTMKHFRGGTAVPDQRLPGGERVHLVSFPVQWDGAKKLWYADIGIRPLPAEHCFVRLALARYQPYAVDNMHVSTAVLADFAQLPGDRCISVMYEPTDANSMTLRVSLFAGGDPEHPGPTPPVVGVATAGIASTFHVEVQKRMSESPRDGGWMKDSSIMVIPSPTSGNLLWTGTLQWPKWLGPRRLIISEEEVFPSGTQSRKRLVYADVLEL